MTAPSRIWTPVYRTIFNALEAHGVMDETIVILNGDHGETLYDHECWFDHHGLYDVTLHVPLIIRYPGRIPAGSRISGYNQHKDLVPTIMDLAEIDGGIDYDGDSLMALVDGTVSSFDSEFYITECTWMRKHGWRTPQWKLMIALEPDFHFKPPVELYNLVEDPDENHNLAGELPEVVNLLKRRMNNWVRKAGEGDGEAQPHAYPGGLARARGRGCLQDIAAGLRHDAHRRLRSGRQSAGAQQVERRVSRSR